MRIARTVRTAFALLRPFRTIARELTRLRELYELELACRTPPIMLVTEEPGRSDTEVSYSGVRDERKPWRRGTDEWGAEGED